MNRTRERKSKGSLSVLDEFTSSEGAGEIIASVSLSTEEIERINERTRLADLPSTRKTDSKQVAKSEQTDSELPKKRIAKSERTDSKQVAETDQKNLIFSELDSKQTAEQIAKQVAVGEQTDSKQVAIAGVEALVGHEKKLLFFIFKECSRVGNLVSPEITLSHIAEILETTTGTAKSAIKRLVDKGFVTRSQSKTGRGGWIKFGISKNLYQDLRLRETDSKEIANRGQTDSKEIAKRVAERVAVASSSNSNILNNNKNTNTEELVEFSIPENCRSLGIGQRQLAAIENQGLLSHDEIQDSLIHFSADLEAGRVKAHSKLHLFFGVLRNKVPYVSQTYSEQLNRELKAELERIRQAQEIEKQNSEAALIAKFDEFKRENPDFIEKTRASNQMFAIIKDEQLLMNAAFEKFKEMELQKNEI